MCFCSITKVIMASSSIDTAELRLGEVFLTRHNAKIASIKNGIQDLILQPEEFLNVPFTPMNFDENGPTARLNLFLHPCRSLLEDVASIDEWLIGYFADHSVEILKKQMNFEEVRESYISCLRHSGKGICSHNQDEDRFYRRQALASLLGRRRQPDRRPRVSHQPADPRLPRVAHGHELRACASPDRRAAEAGREHPRVAEAQESVLVS